MSFWKKTMDYLGLGPDDAYDEYDDQPEPEPPSRGTRAASTGQGGGRSSSARAWPAESDETSIRAVPPARPSFPSRDFESPARRGVQVVGEDSGAHARPARSSGSRVS